MKIARNGQRMPQAYLIRIKEYFKEGSTKKVNFGVEKSDYDDREA